MVASVWTRAVIFSDARTFWSIHRRCLNGRRRGPTLRRRFRAVQQLGEADQSRMRGPDLPVLASDDDLIAELRMLTAHRADRVADCTCTIDRLRRQLVAVCPALQRVAALTSDRGLRVLLSRSQRLKAVRNRGVSRLTKTSIPGVQLLIFRSCTPQIANGFRRQSGQLCDRPIRPSRMGSQNPPRCGPPVSERQRKPALHIGVNRQHEGVLQRSVVELGLDFVATSVSHRLDSVCAVDDPHGGAVDQNRWQIGLALRQTLRVLMDLAG